LNESSRYCAIMVMSQAVVSGDFLFVVVSASEMIFEKRRNDREQGRQYSIVVGMKSLLMHVYMHV
jgi:hypothetical protein